MFRGIHLLSIDSKGRVKIPVRHQEQVTKICSGEMVLSIHPDDPCLVLYPLPNWQQLERKIAELPSLNVHSKKISRKLIGHACDCDLDKIGRILLPSSHKIYANLTDKAILSGQGTSFEIWDEKAWREQIEKLERLSAQNDAPEEISKLAL
jgi:MraZ protein